jgi:CRP-like cAMP-binding protein
VQLGSADPTDPADTVRLINPLYGLKLPPHMTGSPSRNPPPRVFPGTVAFDERDAEPQGTASKLSEEEIRKYEAAGAASGLPPADDVWASLRDPLKGVKLATKKRRLKTVPNCFSGKEATDWFLARYPKMQRAHGQLMMQQLIDKGLLLSATGKGPSPGMPFEDSDSFLLKFKVVNDSAGHLTLTIKEAAGLVEKGGEIYCNLDVKYKKSELSLTTNVWKTQLCKGPVPKWNATFKVPTRVLPQHLQFEAQVFAKHSVGSNAFLGQVEVPLDPLTSGETLEDWFPLQMRRQGEEVRGEILLSLTFTSIDDDDKVSKSSTSLVTSAMSAEQEDSKKDDLGLVEVEDPLEVLAEIPYEFDNPELAGELLVERNAAVPGGLEYKAASLVKLVELVCSADVPAGSTIVDDVLFTYPTFTTGMRLFNLFLKRYIGPPPLDANATAMAVKQMSFFNLHKKDIQNRVGSLLARWMTSTSDFSDNAQLFSYFKKLVEMNFFDPTPSLSKYFAKKYDECRKKRLGQDAVVVEGPGGGSALGSASALAGKGGLDRFASVRGAKGGSGTMRGGLEALRAQVPLLDLNTDEIAEQITLIEHQLFRAIEPIELLNQNWNKHPELSPHVIEYIQWFNKMCQWASTEIIKEDSPESRAVIVAKFIKIADRLAQLNNFNGLMEILASLEGSSIRRLKLTWAELPQADADTLERLAALMKPEKNFKDYRAAIVSSAGKPWIPYLGLHLTDLTFVDDGNTTWIGSNNNLVNLQKAIMSSTCVRTVLDSCKVDFYGIRPMQSIQKLLLNVSNSVFDDNEVYRLSLLREARNAGGDAADRGRGNRNRLANIAKSMMKRVNVAAEKDLTDADWSVVLEGARTVVFKRDQVIIQQGQLNTKMYMMQTGRVRVEKVPEGKTEAIVLTTMEPPKVFGEMSIIMPNNKPAVSCVADMDGMKLYETDYTELHKAFALHPDLARRFYMTMAKKLSEMLIGLVPPTKKKEETPASMRDSAVTDDTEEDSKVGRKGGMLIVFSCLFCRIRVRRAECAKRRRRRRCCWRARLRPKAGSRRCGGASQGSRSRRRRARLATFSPRMWPWVLRRAA